jgi:hypothetical protein
MTGHQINLRISKLTKLKKALIQKDALTSGPSPALLELLLTMEAMSKEQLRELAISVGSER